MSWTIDIPKDVLPDLPPLPGDLNEQFQAVISRDAKHQPSWDPAQAQYVRKILESVPPVVLGPEVGGPRAHSIHHGKFDMQTSISLQHSFIARLKDESLFSMRLITKKFRSRTVGYRARFP